MEHNEFVELVKQGIKKTVNQGYASIGPDSGTCLYKSEYGCCVVGNMMPDDETRIKADTEFTESGIVFLKEEGLEWAKQFTDEQIGLLEELQGIHDDSRWAGKSLENSENDKILLAEDFEEDCYRALERYCNKIEGEI